MTSAMRRMAHDLKDFDDDPCNENIVYVELQNGNLLEVEACLISPRAIFYQDGIFVIKIRCSENYPFSAPMVSVMTNTTYANVRLDEQLMTNKLKQNWMPIKTIKDILNDILGFFENRNAFLIE